MSSPETTTVNTPDGRALEVVASGGGPRTVLFHNGTPCGAVDFPILTRAATTRGYGVVTYSRPGYGGSTPHPGRTVADVAEDVTTVLDSLGVESFVVIGLSGGGPHALATGAMPGDRCRAVATIGGVAPHDADGLDWTAGMGQENLAEFGAAEAGIEPLTDYLSAEAADLATITPEGVAAGLGDLVDEVDRAALTGELAEFLASCMRRAVIAGIDGWRDDDLAFVQPWGFDLDGISVPVAIWQGDHDRMVPKTHGAWLADHIPGCSAHRLADEGHLSLLNKLPEIVSWLDLQGT